MKQLALTDPEAALVLVQNEIYKTVDAKCQHRLHAILLAAKGWSSYQISDLFGDAPRSIQDWINRYEQYGPEGLKDKPKVGRPPKLSKEQLSVVGTALRSSPEVLGFNRQLWDGITLSEFIREEFDTELGIRQCQRILRQLGFRYRKPRPMIAGTEPEVKEDFKKT